MEIRATFIEKIQRTDTVFSFRFIPESPVVFQAGQFLQVILDETDRNNRDLNKYLSFSAAPGRTYFEVTKRLSDSHFSQRMRALKTGERVFFKLPLGNCALDATYKKIGFLQSIN